MSGEPALELSPGFAPLLHAARVVTQSGLADFALIGGLAVATRLTEAAQRGLAQFDARATADVDGLTQSRDGEPPGAHLVAIGAATEGTTPLRILVDGVVVEMIEVEPVDDADLEGLEIDDVLFLGGHWHAAATASELVVIANDDPSSIRVATPAGLVPTKLHAARNRRADRERKVAGDIRDLYCLLAAFDQDGAVAFALRQHQRLGEAVRQAMTELFVDEADRSARRLLVWGDPTTESLTADDLVNVAERFVDRLQQPHPPRAPG
ncbi:MAG: nucleotidyl transferase AbiEii/AbiGii toxin family protein [Actinobacteria bacterium]|nr:nucleotidyl transferase AbiEii/AbiGii toxin family protein [Actinomycetota bacterium]